MAVSVEQFGKAIVASGLMTADEVKAFWSGLSVDARPINGDRFAHFLIDRGKLTAFQAKEILDGRGGRLTMGDYLILQEIGAGGMGQVFKSRHRRMERTGDATRELNTTRFSHRHWYGNREGLS